MFECLINIQELQNVFLTRSSVKSGGSGPHHFSFLRGDILFDHVTLCDDSTIKRDIMADVHLEIQGGQQVALVGGIGSGKSLLWQLLYRLFEPQTGRIMIDGHDLQDLDLESLRNYLGVVPSSTEIFSGALIDNVRLADPRASSEDVVAVCKSIKLHEHIMELPDKYDTYISQQKPRLSSNQMWLLSVARVLLQKPGLLIIDGVPSQLDKQHSFQVEAALQAMMKGKTVIRIAPR